PAAELFEESLASGEARGDLDRRARELTNLGFATRGLGDHVRAHELFHSGLVAAAELGLVETELNAMWGIASYEAEIADALTAARLLGWMNERKARLGARSDADDVELAESVRHRLGVERVASELAAGAA